MAAQHLLDILPVARELSEANKTVQHRQCVLRQLTILRNLSELLKQSRGVKQLFEIDIAVSPGVSCENVTLTVKHLLEGYELDPRFWSFHVSVRKSQVYTLNLDKTFLAGDSETFVVQIIPELCPENNYSERIEVNLVFCMKWSEANYTAAFSLYQKDIDILYLLNPGRRPFSCPISCYTELTESEDARTKYPPVSSFSVSVSEKVMEMFIVEILLCDCNHSRGFNLKGSTSEIIKNAGGEFLAYASDDRIALSVQNQGKLCIMTVTCINSHVLRLVKRAVYRRLVRLCEMDILRLKSGTDCQFEKLNAVKLQTDSVAHQENEAGGNDSGTLLGLFRELRKVSESIVEFRHVSDTKVANNAAPRL